MPNPNNFRLYFDTAQLRLQGDPYLSNLTGFSIVAIDGINDGIIANLQNMQSSFPELSNMTSIELQNIFSEATDIYLANLQQRIPCADCRKNGRRNMITRTFLGMATGGSFGGFYGGWVGAVLGFWDAAGEALNCLSDCTS